LEGTAATLQLPCITPVVKGTGKICYGEMQGVSTPKREQEAETNG